MKISLWIIGLMTGAFIFSGFSIMLSTLNAEYSPLGYNETQLAYFERLDDLNDHSEDIKNNLYNDTLKPDWLDVVGGYIKSGISALKFSWTSLIIFESMAEGAAQGGEMGAITSDFKDFIVGIGIVSFIIGGLVAAYLRWGT